MVYSAHLSWLAVEGLPFTQDTVPSLGVKADILTQCEGTPRWVESKELVKLCLPNPDSKIQRAGAGEMAQWLRALTALPEVLSSIPSNRMVAHNHL